MNKTKDIIWSIKKAVENGQLRPQDVPVNDIIECVTNEIDICKNTYVPQQYNEVREYLDTFCGKIIEGDCDPIRIGMFLDGMLICLATVSQAVTFLVNKDYWMYKYHEKADDPEIMEIIEYIDRKKELRLLNYDFVNKYRAEMYNAFYDEMCNMYYIPYRGRKMYFPEGWDEKKVLDYFCSVVSEQDVLSPHCYKKKGYEVKKGSMIIDVGAAEGIFSLDNIDSAEKIYLIDADAKWVKALRHTFADDMDKTEIIQGYVGSAPEGNKVVVLDGLISNFQSVYIKMDIEGCEKEALEGARRIFDIASDMICAICSYHCKDDETSIRQFLSDRGFETDVSRGYMFPDWEPGSIIDAELRRGIVFGRKS